MERQRNREVVKEKCKAVDIAKKLKRLIVDGATAELMLRNIYLQNSREKEKQLVAETAK